MAAKNEISHGSSETDARNRKFWNQLCGSQVARQLGIEDSSQASLKRFDDWYFEFYPYLYKHIPFLQTRGQKVLEIGLGYGTVSQRLAASGSDYYGLDIAEAPVAMVDHRLHQSGLPGQVMQGSILNAPFASESFSWVIAIGCFHHTGNLEGAFEEARRILKSGGQAVIMVYSAYSYRRWIYSFLPTLRYWFWDRLGWAEPPRSSEKERLLYDVSKEGRGAPETSFVSARQLKKMAASWASLEIRSENIGGEWPFRGIRREWANRVFGPWAGLDLYCRLVK